MNNYKIEYLSKAHQPLIDAFFCAENSETLQQYSSKERRKIIRHSKEIELYLKHEAFIEQEKGLSVTHLLIDTTSNQLIGFITLCNDNLRLHITEKELLKVPYFTIPAVKIARLGVNNNYKNLSFGKFLIGYSVVLISKIKKYSGVAIITLDCYEDKISYYQQIGFRLNINQPPKLEYDNLVSLRITVEELAKYMNNLGELPCVQMMKR